MLSCHVVMHKLFLRMLYFLCISTLNVHKQVIESVKVEVLLGRPTSQKCKEGDVRPYMMNVYEGNSLLSCLCSGGNVIPYVMPAAASSRAQKKGK